MKSDDQLRQDIVEELQWDPAVDERGISVGVQDRVASLTGTVPSYAHKLAVEKAVQRVEGVRAFTIALHISPPADPARADEAVAASAKAVLDATEGLPPGAIDVKADRGCLTLTGSLEWGHQRRAAEIAVGRLRGVVGVVNRIEIRSETKEADIGAKIAGALKRRARVDAERMRIEVHDGVVTLSGAVHSLAEKRAAEGVAWATRGVREVVDRLTVE